MPDSTERFLNDIKAVKQIATVPTMLEVICQTTGMGFAAIARVTENRWIACSVRDQVGFGLKEGGELNIETTLCNEIRDHRKPIIIDHVEEDACYKHHHTPKIYGLQSYISFPIILNDGRFFGTLCAIDAKPAKVNNSKIIGLFTMFSELIAFHLQSLDLLERSYHQSLELQKQNTLLTTANADLDDFVYTAAHDLKSPIANLEGLLTILSATITQEHIDREKAGQLMELMKSSLKRFAITIKDLTTFIEVDSNTNDEKSQAINLMEVIENVKGELAHLLEQTKANIEVDREEGILIDFPRKKLKSILYNLISNALKYRSPERRPEVMISLRKAAGKVILSVSDNGLGIPSDKQEKAFTMFQRFHNHVEGSGLGLYIVKRMIENANGQIQVNSTVGKGTTFTIIF